MRNIYGQPVTAVLQQSAGAGPAIPILLLLFSMALFDIVAEDGPGAFLLLATR